MKNILKAALVSLSIFGVTANAAIVFVNSGGVPAELTIKDYRYYNDGSNNIIEIRVNESISTGCAASDTERKLVYWAAGVTVVHQIILAQATSADAQNRKIHVQYNDSTCNATFGRPVFGVRVLAE